MIKKCVSTLDGHDKPELLMGLVALVCTGVCAFLFAVSFKFHYTIILRRSMQPSMNGELAQKSPPSLKAMYLLRYIRPFAGISRG